MAVNISKYAVNGISSVGWAALNGTYPYGVTGTLSNGSGAGLGTLNMQSLGITPPESAVTFANANNGVLTSFRQQPQELPAGTMASAEFDADFAAKATGIKVATLGDWDSVEMFQRCFSYADIMLLINSPANSLETATLDEAGFVTRIFYKANFDSQAFVELNTATIATFNAGINLKRSAILPWGESLTTATHGTTQSVGRAFYSPNPCWIHTWIANGSATTFTLDKLPVAADTASIKMWRNGTALTYTSDFSVNASTGVVTLVSAGSAGDKLVALYQFSGTC